MGLKYILVTGNTFSLQVFAATTFELLNLEGCPHASKTKTVQASRQVAKVLRGMIHEFEIK